MNQTHISAWAGIGRALRLSTALLAALVMIVAMLSPISARPAVAEEAGDGSGASSETAPARAVSIAIDEATPVVTATSGYHLKATVTNGTDATLPAGMLTLAINAYYTFVSRTDIQDWAQGHADIPTPNTLGTAVVPELKAGSNAQVSVDAAADQEGLKAIATWGPKPLAVSYAAGDATDPATGMTTGPASPEEFEARHAQTHTFLTRSNDGLNGVETPALGLTVAMPLTSDDWQADDDIDAGDSSAEPADSSDSSDAGSVALGEHGISRGRDIQQVLTHHPALQVIADPTVSGALSMPPKATAVMQPAAFDITAYAARANGNAEENAKAYAAAGVNTADWSADTARSLYRQALGDEQNEPTTVAWQGQANWTLAALTQARAQGYDTVIAEHSFDGEDLGTVHTGKLTVPTDAGEVTVLVEQRELGNLAKGKATSKAAKAEAEGSAAGRLARFMAQSAFYQMEQPYTSRNLLVCLDADVDTASLDALMSAVEQAPWLTLTGLDELRQADSWTTGDDAAGTVPTDAGLTAKRTEELNTTLGALTQARSDISRFASSIVSGAAGRDPQALARQDAGESSRRADSKVSSWIDGLKRTQSELALHALSSGSAAQRNRMSSKAGELASRLLDGVSITPSESVTVVSETATMPVTVSNSHAYPVKVRVSSRTDSMEIVTSRFADVTVPAKGEAQVTFTIRVSTTGRTVAHLTLLDRNGNAFGAPQTTAITSALKISDKTGFVLIGMSVVLAVLGLWRQFNRKKDPDE